MRHTLNRWHQQAQEQPIPTAHEIARCRPSVVLAVDIYTELALSKAHAVPVVFLGRGREHEAIFANQELELCPAAGQKFSERRTFGRCIHPESARLMLRV